MPRTTALSADAPWDGDGAVSPDGKTVAFVSDRENNQLGLWITPARAGKPQRIARDLIGVSRPSWSADGKQVLLTRIDPVTGKGTAFLVDVRAGTVAPVAQEWGGEDWRDVVRSSGGTYAAVVRTDSTSAVVQAGAGGSVRPLFDAGTAEPPSHPTWGAKESGVAYAFAGDLWWVAAQGGAPVRLTSTAKKESAPEFSPNGKWLAFVSDSTGTANLWIARFDAKKGQLGPWRPVTAGFQSVGHPTWSRDGKALWFERQSPWTVVAMDENGANVDTLSSSLWDSREPSYLGDDTRVVFSSPRTGPWRIWMMAAAGEARSGPAKQLTQGPREDVDPDASDATGQVAYVDRNDALGTATLSLTDPEGTSLGALTNVALGERTQDWDPAWSPDGRSVAFASNRGGMNAIWVIEGVGRRVRLVTVGEGRVRTPRWSHDGATIYYSALGEGGNVNYKVPAAGGVPEQVSRIVMKGEEDDEPAPSPDGTRFIFTRKRNGDRDLMLSSGGSLVTNSSGQDAHANWSSDGRRIVYETGGAVDLCRADVRPLLLP